MLFCYLFLLDSPPPRPPAPVVTCTDSLVRCSLTLPVLQVLQGKPALAAMITQPEEDDEVEHFTDAPDSDADVAAPAAAAVSKHSSSKHGKDTNKHTKPAHKEKRTRDSDSTDEESGSDSGVESEGSVKSGGTMTSTVSRVNQFLIGSYDPRKRDPVHAGAGKTCLWELVRVVCCCLLLHVFVCGFGFVFDVTRSNFVYSVCV